MRVMEDIILDQVASSTKIEKSAVTAKGRLSAITDNRRDACDTVSDEDEIIYMVVVKNNDIKAVMKYSPVDNSIVSKKISDRSA